VISDQQILKSLNQQIPGGGTTIRDQINESTITPYVPFNNSTHQHINKSTNQHITHYLSLAKMFSKKKIDILDLHTFAGVKKYS
jgi:hypothetical protein